jgi:cell wall-associated NlpC family hydrolase
MENRIRTTASILAIACMLFGCKSKRIVTDSSESKNKHFVSGSLKERYSELLNVNKKDIKNEKLYSFIDDWMGVKHVDGGMTKKGIDCSGFTILLQKEIYNKNLPRVAKQMAEQVKRKYEEQLQEGDLVFFDFDGRKFSHVGIYLKNNKFVHVSTSRGVIISNLKDSWYYKSFSRAGAVN